MDFDSSYSEQWDWLKPLSARQPKEPQPPDLPGSVRAKPRAPDLPIREPLPNPPQRAEAKTAAPTAESVAVVREAAIRLAATQFDPNFISRTEVRELLDLLKNGHVITAEEQDLLSQSPRAFSHPDDEPDYPRDLLGDWQARHDTEMASGNMARLAQSIEALSILTRIRMARNLV